MVVRRKMIFEPLFVPISALWTRLRRNYLNMQAFTRAKAEKDTFFKLAGRRLKLPLKTKAGRAETITITPARRRVMIQLLDTISLGILMREIKGKFSDWIYSARICAAGGGLSLQISVSRKIEKQDLLNLQKDLRACLRYPVAVKIIYEESDAESAGNKDIKQKQEKLIVITPVGNSALYPLMNFEGSLEEDATILLEEQEIYDPVRSKKKNRKKNKFNQNNFREELEETLPSGVRLWKVSFYQMQRGEGALQFVVVKIYIPEDKEREIQEWRNELEKKYRVGIIFKKERVSEGITRQLTLLADNDGILKNHEKVNRLITNIYGAPPELEETGVHRRTLNTRSLENLLDYPFLTIDPVGARDLDDALWAEKLSGDRYRLIVCFADVTESVSAGSAMDLYASRVGFSLYGRIRSIPLLGEDLGYQKLSLLPGKERLCWTVEIELDGQGRILGSRFFRALVKSRAQLSFEEIDDLIECRPDLLPIIQPLREATFALRQKRLARAGFIKFKSEGESYIIVEECMLAAKAIIAATFQSAGVPILFKVHAPPGRFQRKRFIREIKNIGVRARKKDFTDPLKFRSILTTLRELGEMKLFHKILDAYLKRARYDIENHGHHGLGLDAYTEIKGLRNYAGLLNQRQAAYLLCGSTPLAESDLRKYQYKINRKHRIYHDNVIRLITFEMLQEKLAMLGHIFSGEIASVHADGMLINVPGFRSQGLIPVQMLNGLSQINDKDASGAVVLVTLVGYDPLCKRFIFSGGE
jgi:hypothetical protein